MKFVGFEEEKKSKCKWANARDNKKNKRGKHKSTANRFFLPLSLSYLFFFFFTVSLTLTISIFGLKRLENVCRWKWKIKSNYDGSTKWKFHMLCNIDKTVDIQVNVNVDRWNSVRKAIHNIHTHSYTTRFQTQSASQVMLSEYQMVFLQVFHQRHRCSLSLSLSLTSSRALHV